MLALACTKLLTVVRWVPDLVTTGLSLVNTTWLNTENIKVSMSVSWRYLTIFGLIFGCSRGGHAPAASSARLHKIFARTESGATCIRECIYS
jgi:hypothetical protein